MVSRFDMWGLYISVLVMQFFSFSSISNGLVKTILVLVNHDFNISFAVALINRQRESSFQFLVLTTRMKYTN